MNNMEEGRASIISWLDYENVMLLSCLRPKIIEKSDDRIQRASGNCLGFVKNSATVEATWTTNFAFGY